jgi:hypothetical protein
VAFDQQNLSIKRALPTWFSDQAFFEPINKFSHAFITDAIKKLFGELGVYQPWQVWKNIAHHYNWQRTFDQNDKLLSIINLGYTPQAGYDDLKTSLGATGDGAKIIKVALPLTQRPVHARIRIILKPGIETKENINFIEISNADQTVKIKDIKSFDEILYETDGNVLRINDESRDSQLEGSIKKIYSTAILDLLRKPNLGLEDRNAENFITITSSGEKIDFNLNVELIRPTYIVDQNIRLWSIAALPLKKVELYGYFCHQFNNNHGWKLLDTKTYDEEDRVIFDRYTTQYDTEIFFIKVWYHSLEDPIAIGFPQEEFSPNPIFKTNTILDYWGKFYGLSRQYYKDDISEDNEINTKAARYYNYNIEQDKWYEDRLSNEYRINEFEKDGIWIKDSAGVNLALVKSRTPYIEDLQMYTESTPKQSGEMIKELVPSAAVQHGEFSSWIEVGNLKNLQKVKRTYTIMEPFKPEYYETKKNRSNLITMNFDLSDIPDYTELTNFGFQIDLGPSLSGMSIQFDERCNVKIPYLNDEGELYWKVLPLNYLPSFEPTDRIYEILSTDFEKTTTPINLALLKKEGMEFNLGFTNTHEHLEGEMNLYGVRFNIAYKMSKKEITLDTELDHRIIRQDRDGAKLTIKIENTGKIPIIDEKIFIFSPNLNMSKSEIDLNLDLKEKFEETIDISSDVSGFFDIYVFVVGATAVEQFVVLRDE